MQVDIYNKFYQKYFTSKEFECEFSKALEILNKSKKVFFIGNGGSNAICSHMLEDFAKIGRFKTYSFSDAALITCYANDYGYENAIAEWLKIHFEKGDLLVAISSSGNSMNIVNAVEEALQIGGTVITLSGFNKDNKLFSKGEANFHLEINNYGIVECFHQIILHVLLDEYTAAPRSI